MSSMQKPKVGHEVLVELALISLNNQGPSQDQIREIFKITDQTGLVNEELPNGSHIAGDWEPVLEIIRACYQRARKYSSQFYLKAIIR